MRLTVLGASPSCPNPGGACSGYLVEDGGVRILLDCGTGVSGMLQKYADFRWLDAIVISHMHADHFIDLIPLRYGLRYRPGEQRTTKIPLYLPSGGSFLLHHVMAPIDDNPSFFTDFFDIVECEQGRTETVGTMSIDFLPVCHFIDANGIIVRGSSKLGFSADSGPCEQVAEVAKDADLFICEASLPEGYEGARGLGHMKASERRR